MSRRFIARTALSAMKRDSPRPAVWGRASHPVLLSISVLGIPAAGFVVQVELLLEVRRVAEHLVRWGGVAHPLPPGLPLHRPDHIVVVADHSGHVRGETGCEQH